MIALPAGVGIVRPASGGGPVSYIGGTFEVNQTSATPSLAVPVGSITGDTVIAILRCRGDRAMSGFAGWTTVIDSILPTTEPGSSANTRVYILSRILAAEASFAFTQSSASAYGAALLVFRNGPIGANTLVDATSATITKASSASLLLAVAMFNGSTATGAGFTSYTNLGITSFFTSPNYFFVASINTRYPASAGPQTATGSFPAGSGRATWLAEIG